MKTFDQLRREHAQAQSEYLSAVTVLVTAALHVLHDEHSTLHPVSEKLLRDATDKVTNLKF